MYTIKQAAARTGVPQATLRAWERRYGVVTPRRSGGGYRLYDDDHLAAIRRMADLVAAGMPASLAATAGASAADKVHVTSLGPIDDLASAAAGLDVARVEAVLRHAFGCGIPFERVVDEWLLPQLREIGEAWRRGQVTIAQEHMVTAAVMRTISAFFDRALVDSRQSPVLVGLPAQARHEAALLCFSVCLKRKSLPVVYLGPDVPTTAWQRAVEQLHPQAVVLGVHRADDVPVAQSVIDALAEHRHSLGLWVGGSHRGGVNGAQLLPDRVSDAATMVFAATVER